MTRENKLERFSLASLTLEYLPRKLPINWGKVDFSIIRTCKTRPKNVRDEHSSLFSANKIAHNTGTMARGDKLFTAIILNCSVSLSVRPFLASLSSIV
jgi:hypothetical protein